MEAPEKIYCESDGLGNIIKAHNIKWPDDEAENTEYTRTDAFIEKVRDGIEHLLSGYIIKNFHFGDSYEIDTFIEDLKNYIKEE